MGTPMGLIELGAHAASANRLTFVYAASSNAVAAAILDPTMSTELQCSRRAIFRMGAVLATGLKIAPR